jgi:Raf kinase inhibitor-like YbhB/YbcL family protein
MKVFFFLICLMGKAMALTVTSSAFQHNASMPSLYTCDEKGPDGQDTSPPLDWGGLSPENQNKVKTFVLICDDPDAPDPKAPKMTWDHWIIFNIPASITHLDQNVKTLPAGCRQGNNSWKKQGYGGPCPPIGQHRYFFKLYALDTELSLPDGSKKAEIEAAMDGHVLEKAELIGLYQKQMK